MISQTLNTVLQAIPLSLIAGTPLLFAMCCFIPGLRNMVARLLPLAALPGLAAAFLLSDEIVVEVPWFFMGSSMGLDETGRIFLAVTASIWFIGSMSMITILRRDNSKFRFTFLYCLAMMGNFGLILAREMLGYYLFFAIMSFAAYGLIVHNNSQEAKKAGRSYLILLMTGEIALFIGLVILTVAIGSQDIAEIRDTVPPVALLLLYIGFGVKIGALPLHGWMVRAYQVTPVPAAAILAGAMVNAGLLGWFRFLPLGRITCPKGAFLFIVAGALAAFYGVVRGMREQQAGAILGCSSISQMGLMTCIFGLGLTSLEAGDVAAPLFCLYAVHHALLKSSLFLGCQIYNPNSRYQTTILTVVALALAGLPFTSGAIIKTGFKKFMLQMDTPWPDISTFFLPATAIGTTILMLHFIKIVQAGQTTLSKTTRPSKIPWLLSLILAGNVLWLWPAAASHALHSLSLTTIIHTVWPIAAGWLIFFLLQQKSQKKTTVSPSAKSLHPKSRLSNCNLPIAGLQSLSKMAGHSITHLIHTFNTTARLRQGEKILGRWLSAGLIYTALCLLFFFL